MKENTENKAVEYHGEISDAEYNKFKAVHGNIHRLEVPLNDEFSEIAVCYLKPVDRQFMSAVLSVEDKVARSELMLAELWLAGDERIKLVDELFFSASVMLNALLSFRRASLKKNYTRQSK